MQGVRDKASGNDSASLLKAELQLHPRHELQRLLQELELDKIVVPHGHLLAAKVGMGMNWSQLRKLKRWLKQYGVKMESEAISRKLAAEMLSGFKVEAENLPFSVKGDKESTVKLLPCAYVTSLRDAIYDYLERSNTANSLIWHDKTIPEGEIWIKVGGDHGGGTFKMAFQILNKTSPNSQTNTTVFCIFDAKDTRENLTLATGRYAQELKDLQVSKWRSKDGKEFQLRVFGAGDYAYLCLWYGLSGACGSHPCLWCHIKLDELKDKDDRRLHIPPRTLESLAEDHRKFITVGKGKLKDAKHYNNAVCPVMYAVPIEQAMIPGLHISLGVYLKLFNLFEAELQDIDLKIQSYTANAFKEGEATREEILSDEHLARFKGYLDAIDEARAFDHQAEALEEEIEEQECNKLAWLAYSDGADDSMAEEIFTEACSMIEDLTQRKETLREKAENIRKRTSVKIGQGPLTSELDIVLNKYRVRRQAYHSNSFIGNHVHRMLKDDAIEGLTSAVKTTINSIMGNSDNLPISLMPLVTATAEKYKQLFTLFAQCHKRYSRSEPMNEEAVNELARAITSFMAFYRERVPNGTVPVKMHMLEDHVVPCIRRWGFGLGFLGEQGLEQVHALFNSISRTTCGVADPVARLKSSLKEHLIGVSPDHKGGVPEPVPRKKKD
ncbi:uncharacterized protein [Branchiostoma lanceolatum]|uniref:uncharacterized protein n=1 Tax=Branchiostoma lanceolatum TaxID=7740 RepID=UPI0034536C41